MCLAIEQKRLADYYSLGLSIVNCNRLVGLLNGTKKPSRNFYWAYKEIMTFELRPEESGQKNFQNVITLGIYGDYVIFFILR